MKFKRFNQELFYCVNDVGMQFSEMQNDDGSNSIPDEIELPLFREGSFDHWRYGRVDITREALDSMVTNFNNKVLPTDVPGNIDHIPSLAMGWISQKPGNLYVRDEVLNIQGKEETRAVLYGRWRPNKKAKRHLADDDYRYVSAEVHPNYSTNEIVENDRGGEGVVYHGYTLTGFALTNRPFIPNMSGTPTAQKFSIGSEEIEDEPAMIYYSEREGDHYYFCANYDFDKSPADEKEEVVPPVDDKKENDMQFSEVLNKLLTFSTPADKVNYLSGVRAQLNDSDKATADSLIQTYNDSATSQLAVEKAMQEAEAAKRSAQEYSNKLAEARVELARAKVQRHADRVQAFCAKLENDGHTPALVGHVKMMFSSLSTEHQDRTFKFSLADGEQEMDLMEFMDQVFSKLPRDGKPGATDANVEEVTPPTDEPGNDDSGVPANVQKFAKRQGKIASDIDKSLWELIDEDGNFSVSN